MFVVALFAGCTSPSVPAGQCRYDSDCSSGQVCIATYCRQSCASDADCGSGRHCVRDGASMICADDSQPRPCLYAADCPENSICTRDGICQAQCRTNYDCEVTNPYFSCQSGRCELHCADGHADCDGNVRNGCETDTRADLNHCGACGTRCAAGPHEVARCAAGACGATCEPGWANCDGDRANGCEADLSDATHCGACAAACPSDRPFCQVETTPESPRYTCVARCDDPAAPIRCGSSCVNLNSDAVHCGRCDNACAAAPNTTPACVAGVCAVQCVDHVRYDDCDHDPANGCESELPVDTSNCGACGTSCATGPHARPACMTGACAITCDEGFGNCDGAVDNGCEVDTRATATSCGSCGNICPAVANAAPTCTAGRCGFACNTGFGDCDGNAANGCETDLTTDVEHCGGCSTRCAASAGSSASCTAGACASRCAAGRADCDGNMTNGCEVDTRTDAANCATCGHACSVSGGRGVCEASVCAVGACDTGFADCDGDPGNGCEVDTRVNAANCARCGNVCRFEGAGARCAAGVCERTSCAAGLGDCDGMTANGCETDLNTSVGNCGACGNACRLANATAACGAGACRIAACNAGFADCDGNPTNGCEVDLRTSAGNCSRCGLTCNGTNGTPSCAASACLIACDAGFGNCDGNANNGCEVNLNTTVASCGACARACAPANASGACRSGRCEVAACNTGFADCDGNPANGCEVDLRTTVASCGACGAACSATNGTPACAAGACSITCATGFGNCDGSVANGCETATTTSVANCGACGRACSLPNATAACAAGACRVAVCNAGFGDCDGNPANGCEVNLNTTVGSCGRCGNACNATNGVAACTAGACGITCNAGFGDCDGSATNGCEVNLNTTPASCGACGRACNATNGTPACAAGMCSITCAAGFGNCNASAVDGCETNLNTTVTSCGACGTTCSLAHATAACVGGACAVGSCATGFGNCDGVAANGCETDLNVSNANCRACGTVCAAGTVCSAGSCSSVCGTGLTFCSGTCVDVQTSVPHCGTCGHGCTAPANATATCAAGACGFTCAAGFADCNGVATDGCEVNLNTTVGSCGRCGNACSAANGTPACAGGMCSITCATGFGNCDGNVANGCETDTRTSATHCGACGATCAPAHATPACVGGACGVGACDAGWGNCDGNAANGCETDLNTTVGSCGRCGNACNATNGVASCAAGACGIACSSGFGNCDGSAANGCETNLTSSAANCGACGAACNATNGTPSCASSTCGIACNAGFGNCDGVASNGCETNLTSSAANCGACGSACSLANASSACSGGACAVVTCNAGFGNCDGVAANGCETNLNTSAGNCGACARACSLANATASCAAGQCAVASCNAGFGDCDGVAANGCEVNLNTTPGSCGACGRACSLANATAGCAGGACTVASCNANFGNCDGVASNGCETDLNTSNANCRACGTVCAAGTVCSAGACTSVCSSPTTYCAGTCVNLSTDTSNCGSCGRICTTPPNARPTCVSSTCGASCNTGFGDCNMSLTDGCETNLNTTVSSCGRCGNACALANATNACAAGQCAIASCNAGFGNCDGLVATGCETNLNTTVSSCGACGNACSFTNATATCAMGTCAIASCNAGFGNCDGNTANGCETQTATSVANCGSCGNACNSTNGTASCSGGACGIACNANWGNCDGSVANGCETPLLTTVTSCGACGRACSLANATPRCSDATCLIASCNAGYANCNGSTADGCEVTLATDNANCGACGNACAANAACVAGVCRPTNDTCATATALNLSSNTHLDVPFTVVNADHSITSGCDTLSGVDVFFSFTLTQREVVYADTFGAPFDTVLFFTAVSPRTGLCAPLGGGATGAVACNDDATRAEASGGPGCTTAGLSSMIVGVYNPGTYYIAVAGHNTATGSGTLHVEHLPATTTGVITYTPEPRTRSQYVGNPGLGSTSSVTTSCGAGGRGPDETFWWWTCPNQAAITLQASTCYGSTTDLTTDTILELRHGSGAPGVCNDDLGIAGCSVNGNRSGFTTTLPAGAGLHVITGDMYQPTATGTFSVVFNEIVIGARPRRGSSMFATTPRRPALPAGNVCGPRLSALPSRRWY